MAQRIQVEEALRIAREDAEKVYRDLSRYQVTIKVVDGDWQVDYDLLNNTMRGGGPHYLISGTTGAILTKRYEQ